MNKKINIIIIILAILFFIAIIICTNDNVKKLINTKILLPICIIAEFALLFVGLYLKSRK